MIEAAAPTDSVVLFTGESGTGKELLARRMHALSARGTGPFVKVNCAAVPVEMWESEFFGHRKGSFAGAAADREGRFQLADRGTLLLDEVGAMLPAGQAKLLRVIQDGEFERLGDDESIEVDVRVLLATNIDLKAAVERGDFREDLYHRINVVNIDMPLLRERSEDIVELAAHFMQQFSQSLGMPALDLDEETLLKLRRYDWPGNVRELRNLIERSVILGAFPQEFAGQGAVTGERAIETLDLVMQRHIMHVLDSCGGNRAEAARILEIGERTLYRKIKEYNLS